MNKLLLLCGQGRTLFSKLPAIKPATIISPSIAYKPIQICSRYLQTITPVTKSKAPLNIDTTKLVKDVIVYKYENPSYFKYLNIFAVGQFIVLSYFAQNTLANLRNTPVDEQKEGYEKLVWYEKLNLGKDSVRMIISAACFLIGFGVLSICWLKTLRSVRYLIIRKGGNEVSFVTYGPLGTNRIKTVPLNCIQGMEDRTKATAYLPLKVKNINWFYVLDVRGEYRQKEIFDHVINVNRKFWIWHLIKRIHLV